MFLRVFFRRFCSIIILLFLTNLAFSQECPIGEILSGISGLAGKGDDFSSANKENLEALEDIEISAADPATGRGSVVDGLTFGLNFFGKLETNKVYNLEMEDCLEGNIEIRETRLFYQDTTSVGSPGKLKDPQPLDPTQEVPPGGLGAGDPNQTAATAFARRVSEHINGVHDGRRVMEPLPGGGFGQGTARPERRNLRGHQGASTRDLLKQMVDGIRKELVKQLGEPPKIPCGEKKAVTIELKLEGGYHLRGSSLSTGEFVKYTLIWTIRITIGCKNTAECCPTVPTVVGPQDQPTEEEGGTLLGPTPTEKGGVEAPPTGDIGTGGGAGGAGSAPSPGVERTCNNFILDRAVALRAGERVEFKVTANFFPNEKEMFSQFVGFSVQDSAGKRIGSFGRQIHAGVQSNFGSTAAGDSSQEVISSLSPDGTEVTISVPGAVVPRGARATVQSGCMQTSAGPFQDKSNLSFDILIQ